MANEELILIGADAGGALDALDALIASLDETRAAAENLGASGDAIDSTILGPLQELTGVAESATTAMDDLAAGEDAAAASAEGLSGAFDLLTGAADSLWGSLTTMLPMFLEFEAIGGAIQAIQGFVGNMIGMNEQFQRMDVTLRDMVGEQRAQQLIAWVQKFGTEVPFTTEAVSSATVAITAFGQNAEQVLPAVAAAAAAMASRGVTLDTATRAFIDAMNGRFIMLQNTLGISKEELVKFGLELNSKGQVINNSFVPAFEKLVAAKYPTILADQMGTFGGMLAEANDLLQLFAMHLGAPLFAAAQEGLGMVMQFVSDHQTDLDHLAEVAGGILADGFRFFGDVIAGVGVILKTVIFPIFQGLGNLIQPLLGPLGALGGALGKLATVGGGGLLGWLKGAADGFLNMTKTGGPLPGIAQGIAGGIQQVAGWVNNLSGGFKSFFQWFQPTVASVQKFGDMLLLIPGKASGFMQTMQAIGTFFKPLIDLFGALGAIFVNIGIGIGQFAQQMNIVQGFLLPFWQNIQQQLGPALQQIWQTIQTQLMPAFEQLATALQPLMPLFQFLGYIIGGVLLTALDTFLNVLASLATLITGVVNGALEFLAGGIKMIADVLTFFTDLFTGNFTKLKQDALKIWNDFVLQLKGIWDATGGNIINAVAGFVDNFLTWIQYLADTLVGHSIWPDMLNTMINQLAGFPGRAMAIIHQFGGAVVGFFTTLAMNAFTWGEDLIMNLINGIRNMLPALAGAASAAAQTVQNLLGHSEPKEGPLQGDSQWGRHLIENIVAGMQGGLPLLKGMSQQVAGAMVPNFGGVPAGAVAGGISGVQGGLSTGNIEVLLRELIQVETAKQGGNQLGASPVPATTGSVVNFGGVNINAAGQNLQTLYNELNMLGGLAAEYAKRGAVNP